MSSPHTNSNSSEQPLSEGEALDARETIQPPPDAGPDGAVGGGESSHLGGSPGMRSFIVKSRRPGGDYVRTEMPLVGEFRYRGGNVYEATERTLEPSTALGRAGARAKRVIFGSRIATSQQANERLTKVKALAVLSSDAISSVAYGTEASLAILIGAGFFALQYNLIIAACIALLMAIVGSSYWQTIHAYPHGGGSYIVARDNMGDWPGLIAAAALLIDYVLTVSVSVSSGVDALVSAVSGLQPYSVELGVLFILLIMVVNLRGVRESGTIFAAPTYLFIACFLIMIVTGLIHAALSPGGLFVAAPPHVVPNTAPWPHANLGILLILTAFASGCSAMTGVEAISNGVPAFKAPEANNAARTLIWMIAILMTLFLGVTYLAWRFGVTPVPGSNPTLDAQIASLLFVGPFGWFFYVVQFATLLILVLAANTSFADFPRLASILARDRFLPSQFSFRGDRLAFTTGIVVLSLLSSLLLVVFNGSTDALINLYALGVFTAFTLSQSGMVLRWLRMKDQAGPGWRRSMLINGVGAVITGIVALIVMVTKFDRGAWVVVLLVPMLVLAFRSIHKHYQYVQQQMRELPTLRAEEIRHIAIVPIAGLNRVTTRSIAYARSITPNVMVVHISTEPGDEQGLREQWQQFVKKRKPVWQGMAQNGEAGGANSAIPQRIATRGRSQAVRAVGGGATEGPQFVIIESPYRSLVAPLLSYIASIRKLNPGATVSVILPEFIPAHWWESLLHNQTALRLKLALYSQPDVVVVNVPYHLPRRPEQDADLGRPAADETPTPIAAQ